MKLQYSYKQKYTEQIWKDIDDRAGQKRALYKVLAHPVDMM